MKEMKTNQIRTAIIEIILGKEPSNLKLNFPEHYKLIRKEIVDYHSAGRMAKIPAG
jgi:hypothetical protein